jgi:AraC-like DNA-binding protein
VALIKGKGQRHYLIGSLMNNNKPTASLIYLKILFRILDSYGVNTKEFSNRINLTALHPANSSRANSDVIAGVWKQAADFTRIDNLALKAGMNAHPSDYGVISYAWMNCSNFHEIMELVCRYKPLLNEAFSARLEPIKNGYEYILESTSNNDSYLIEYDFASILHMGYFSAGKSNEQRVRISSIEFKHAANTSYENYKKCFNCELKFSQKTNRILLSDDVLNTPVVSPKPEVLDAMLSIVEKIKYDELGEQTLTEKVSSYLEDKVSKGLRPSQDETAAYFDLPPSTFKRRLGKEECTFTELLNTVLMNKSLSLLSRKILPISDISSILGFSNSAAFHRSFKRWTGVTPLKYRNDNKSDEPE